MDGISKCKSFFGDYREYAKAQKKSHRFYQLVRPLIAFHSFCREQGFTFHPTLKALVIRAVFFDSIQQTEVYAGNSFANAATSMFEYDVVELWTPPSGADQNTFGISEATLSV